MHALLRALVYIKIYAFGYYSNFCNGKIAITLSSWNKFVCLIVLIIVITVYMKQLHSDAATL